MEHKGTDRGEEGTVVCTKREAAQERALSVIYLNHGPHGYEHWTRHNGATDRWISQDRNSRKVTLEQKKLMYDMLIYK